VNPSLDSPVTLSSDRPLTLPSVKKQRIFLRGLLAVASAALLSAAGLHNLLIAAGALYVTVFWFIAWRYPAVALMLIFASAPFQNDLSGGGDGAKFSLAEINLVLTIPVIYIRWLAQKRQPHVGPLLLPVLLYFTVCLCSSAINWHGSALISLIQMLLYLVIVVAVFNVFALETREYRLSFEVLVGVGVFLAIAGLATDYWFIGLNKNGIADSLACSFLVCVEMILSARSPRRRYVMMAALAVIALGLLFSLSRGAWLGTIGGVVCIFTLRRKLPELLKIAVMMLPLLALFWYFLPDSSKDYATGFGQDHYNIQMRYNSIDLAERYFNESPLYGMGVGLRKDYDATNVLLMVLAETGVLGLVGFILIHLTFYKMLWKAHTRIPTDDALFTLLCIGGALVMNKFVHGLVDHYWSRGALMATWASAGMATRAYYETRNFPALVRQKRQT